MPWVRRLCVEVVRVAGCTRAGSVAVALGLVKCVRAADP